MHATAAAPRTRLPRRFSPRPARRSASLVAANLVSDAGRRRVLHAQRLADAATDAARRAVAASTR
jgi:hypothetical protein